MCQNYIIIMIDAIKMLNAI